MRLTFLYLLFLLFLFPFHLSGHESGGTGFIRNQGQWNNDVLFRSDFSGVNFFAEKGGFTYDFYDQTAVQQYFGHGSEPLKEDYIRHHSLKMNFLNAENPVITAEDQFPEYFNYFIGNNQKNWASEVRKYRTIHYKGMYNGVDMVLKGMSGYVKYDLIVEAGTDPSVIQMKWNGSDKLYIDNGNLVVTTSLGEIIEQAPIAWNLLDNKRIPVQCEFHLNGDIVTFSFPSGYNKSLPLIIDPNLVFASYSGSYADNFGMTATYDTLGNLYAGGIAFSSGYPVTTGAYDQFFTGTANATSDAVISKYNSNGTSLIYSTYLGGNETETISSLVVNSNNELYALGVTSSYDFPALSNAFDNTFNGGVAADFISNGAHYYSGTDIYVVHFNAAGSGLIGSTFIGGSHNDGLNYNTSNLALIDSLAKNYGDILRGEIIVDSLGNCYIASSTYSTNFPVANALQNSNGGKQDAVVFKMDPGLTTLSFSTYLGGSQKDAGYSLKQDPAGNIFVTGGTSSSNFPVTTGTLNTSYQGGQTDGYIVSLSPAGTAMNAGSYFGTSAYDQSYFVETDKYGDVYLFGQTLGNLPITSGIYSNSNSAQFITKINNSLTSLYWTTRFGNGNGQLNLSPTAFLVDRCLNIYISGWGGSLIGNSPVTGMPLTSDAFQSTTDGYNFYLAAFYREMTGLAYATYFGGSSSKEHVDGGTSRFDKAGIVYQSVCAGCWGNSDMPTTFGAVSDSNNSSGCNNGVFKFDFDVQVKSEFTPSDTSGCIPFTIQFTNNSGPSTSFLWDFGNGDTTSTDYSPVRVFTDTGTFVVMLIVTDTICGLTDTAFHTIHLFDEFTLNVTNDTLVCDSNQVPLIASTNNQNVSYHWASDTTFTDTLNIFPNDSIMQTGQSGTYYLSAFTPTCKKLDSVRVDLHPLVVDYDSSIELCFKDTILITLQNLIPNDTVNYNWLSNPGIVGGNGFDSILISPSTAGYVYFAASNQHGCTRMDSIYLNMSNLNFLLNVTSDSTLCSPDSVFLYATNNGAGSNYVWSTMPGFTDTINNTVNDSSIIAFIDSTRTFYIKSTVDGCSQKDSVYLDFAEIKVNVDPISFCVGQTGILTADIDNSGSGEQIAWTPINSILGPSNMVDVTVKPSSPTWYFVDISNNQGCSARDSALVSVKNPANASIDVERDTIYITQSTSMNVLPPGSGYVWVPETGLQPLNSGNPVATPTTTTTYTVTYFDQNGCQTSAKAEIVVIDVICEDPYIYIPNAFSPNGDGVNDRLFVRGSSLQSLHLMIYDRWGELVFQTNDPQVGWDGTYKGKLVDPAVFVYHMRVVCIGGSEYFKKGNITVIR